MSRNRRRDPSPQQGEVALPGHAVQQQEVVGARLAGRVIRGPGQQLYLRMRVEESRDLLEQIARIPALIVGKANDLRRRESELGVSYVRHAVGATHMSDANAPGLARNDRLEPIVGILVDDDEREIGAALSGKRFQQAA